MLRHGSYFQPRKTPSHETLEGLGTGLFGNCSMHCSMSLTVIRDESDPLGSSSKAVEGPGQVEKRLRMAQLFLGALEAGILSFSCEAAQ